MCTIINHRQRQPLVKRTLVMNVIHAKGLISSCYAAAQRRLRNVMNFLIQYISMLQKKLVTE